MSHCLPNRQQYNLWLTIAVMQRLHYMRGVQTTATKNTICAKQTNTERDCADEHARASLGALARTVKDKAKQVLGVQTRLYAQKSQQTAGATLDAGKGLKSIKSSSPLPR